MKIISIVLTVFVSLVLLSMIIVPFANLSTTETVDVEISNAGSGQKFSKIATNATYSKTSEYGNWSNGAGNSFSGSSVLYTDTCIVEESYGNIVVMSSEKGYFNYPVTIWQQQTIEITPTSATYSMGGVEVVSVEFSVGFFKDESASASHILKYASKTPKVGPDTELYAMGHIGSSYETRIPVMLKGTAAKMNLISPGTDAPFTYSVTDDNGLILSKIAASGSYDFAGESLTMDPSRTEVRWLVPISLSVSYEKSERVLPAIVDALPLLVIAGLVTFAASSLLRSRY